MKSVYHWFLTLLLTTVVQHAGAQFSADYNFKFRTYTAKDGLVHNYTKKCITDRKGFLWIITEHGVSCFDGMEFKNFEHVYNDSSTLPENDLEDIAVDKNNRIWLCYKRGMCYYDQAGQKFHEIKLAGQAFPRAMLVYDSTRDCMWTSDYTEYFKIDCATLKITTYPYQKPMTTQLGIEQLFVDSRDRLWVLMDRRGYYTIDLKTNSQYYFDRDIWPMQVYEDRENKIWMTTWSSGFRKITVSGNTHQHTLFVDPYLPSLNPYDDIYYGITESKNLSGDNILWITKSTEGVVLFDKKTEKFVSKFKYDPNIKNGIATNFNNRAFTDPNGIVWLCTRHGLTKINQQEQQFNSRELAFLQTRNYNRLSGIISDPYDSSMIWLGVEGSGIVKYNRLLNIPVQRYFSNAGNGLEADLNDNWRWVKGMLTDNKKNIWAITSGGLIEITKGIVIKQLITENNESVYPLNFIQYPSGTLWLTTARGLVSYDINSGTYKIIKCPVNPSDSMSPPVSLRDLVQGNDGNLWVAGKGGAFRYNINSGVFTKLSRHIPGLDSAGQRDCYCIRKINKHIYIGTISGLIDYNSADNTTAVIGTKEGINKIYLYRLKTDSNGMLWVFTSHGLFKYNPQAGTFEQFTTSDGIYDLSEDQIGFFEFENKFYIGYRMAMTSFDPLSVNVNKIKSDPAITGIDINKIPLAENIDSFADHELHLSYSQNNINFSFTSADFTNSDKITFAYRLDGYDKDWIFCGTARSATYANLKGGSYIFRVKACNSSGLWNDKEQQVHIKIATPFWQTVWFYILIALLIFFIAYLLYRYRLNRLVELYKIRDTISKNLHDEIGATLSSINIYSDVARKKNTGDADSGHLMERIYKTSGHLMESMNDIVWYVNPKNDTWDNIIVRMREYAIPLLEAKDINPDFKPDESVLRYRLDMQQRQHVYFIFKEAINNVVKYADASELQVTFDKKDKNISLVIQDNGKGFDLQNVRKGNGLLNMQQRAEMMKGELQVYTEPAKGTTIRLRVPIT